MQQKAFSLTDIFRRMDDVEDDSQLRRGIPGWFHHVQGLFRSAS